MRTQLRSLESFQEDGGERIKVSEGTTGALLSHAFLAGAEEPGRPQEAPQELPKNQDAGTHPQFDFGMWSLICPLFVGLLLRPPLCKGSCSFNKKFGEHRFSLIPLPR